MTDDDPHDLVWDPDRHIRDREPRGALPAPDTSGRATGAAAHGDDWSDVPWLLDPALPGDGGLPRVPTRPLREHDDVLDLLLQLVGPERAGPPALWFVLLDADDWCLPVVLPLAEVPLTASPGVAAHVMHVLASVLDRDAPGGSVLVGLVRAAGGDRGAFETSWAPVLRDAADEQGARIRAVAAIGASRARVIEW